MPVLPFGVVWGQDGSLVAHFSNTRYIYSKLLWVSLTMTRYKQRYLMGIPARELDIKIVPEKVCEQLYFHTFTGCDIVSAFRRKGK